MKSQSVIMVWGLRSSHMIKELHFDCLVHLANLAWKALCFRSGGYMYINPVPYVLGQSQSYCISFV